MSAALPTELPGHLQPHYHTSLRVSIVYHLEGEGEGEYEQRSTTTSFAGNFTSSSGGLYRSAYIEIIENQIQKNSIPMNFKKKQIVYEHVVSMNKDQPRLVSLEFHQLIRWFI